MAITSPVTCVCQMHCYTTETMGWRDVATSLPLLPTSECPSQKWFSSWQGGSQGSHQLWQEDHLFSCFFLLLVHLAGFLYIPN